MLISTTALFSLNTYRQISARSNLMPTCAVNFQLPEGHRICIMQGLLWLCLCKAKTINVMIFFLCITYIMLSLQFLTICITRSLFCVIALSVLCNCRHTEVLCSRLLRLLSKTTTIIIIIIAQHINSKRYHQSQNSFCILVPYPQNKNNWGIVDIFFEGPQFNIYSTW